ncbi:unnamed protein product [marine sediment metagenome]|uniref:Uncharacterized protein n=1 Tax=marine sediment metagenome TaxID=412755 RepID=X1NH97_9ZZZZ
MRKKIDKGTLKEYIMLLIQNSCAHLIDAGLCTSKWSVIDRKIEHLFETEYDKSDFLVRLGFLLVEAGLYPERFQAKID